VPGRDLQGEAAGRSGVAPGIDGILEARFAATLEDDGHNKRAYISVSARFGYCRGGPQRKAAGRGCSSMVEQKPSKNNKPCPNMGNC
jgi:hypothetical protein